MDDFLDKISKALETEDEDSGNSQPDEILYAPAKNGKFWNRRRRMKLFEEVVEESEKDNSQV